jgi:hypothetical protein
MRILVSAIVFVATVGPTLASDAKLYRSLPGPELLVGAFMNGHPMLGETRHEKAGGALVCRRVLGSASPSEREVFRCYRRFDTANAKEIYAALTVPEMPLQTSKANSEPADTGVFEKADDGILCRRSADGTFNCYAH